MNIGFDGKRAANNLTGLGNYSRSLISQLAQFFPQNQYLVYTPKVKEVRQIKDFFKLENITAILPNSSKLLWRSWSIKKQLLADHIDIYHGLSHEIPINIHKTDIASVVTIHDLIFLKFPQYFKLIDRLIYTFKCRYACLHADKIIAISEQTKRDIISFFQIKEDKIEVIYQGCDKSFKIDAEQTLKEQVKHKFDLPEKYILNVGTVETRKNLLVLIKALPAISNKYKLVIVGKETPYKQLVLDEINRLNIKDRVIFLQDVAFNELPAIYQMACLFVYPSLYEGFGIPIIEALYSKVPVVAATGSCLEEAGGPDSHYTNPTDATALSQTINSILENPLVQETMKEKGFQYVQRFNDNLIAAKMMTMYQNVINLKSNRTNENRNR
jgi:glycosyltransferase involved in cell wall biosynthesis